MVLVLGRQLLVVIENEERVVAHIVELDKASLEKNRLVALNRLASEIKHCSSAAEVARRGLELSLEVTPYSAAGIHIAATARCRPRFFASQGTARAGRLQLLKVARELFSECEKKPHFGVCTEAQDRIRIIHRGHVGECASIAAIPLVSRSGPLGVLCLATQFEQLLDRETLRTLLWPVASHLAIALESAQRYEEARYLAERDSVSGLLNRRGMTSRLEEEIIRSLRSGSSFSVVMMDLDKFKKINDTYGHAAGDEVLTTVSRLLLASVRRSDIVGRYGGDEFLALLTQTDSNEALPLIHRVRETISGFRVTLGDGVDIPLSMSYGIATYPQDGCTVADVLAVADENLYRSKQSGGDRIVVPHSMPRAAADREAVLVVLRGLVSSVGAKDHYTQAHSEEVSRWSVRLARALGLSSQEQRSLRLAGLLHDIGKLGVPHELLLKPGPLTAPEYETVKQHVYLGQQIIREIPEMSEVLGAVVDHHERWDGRGYPRGLRGTEISLLGRVLAVCDAYSAMTTERPYRRPLDPPTVQKELERAAGSQLDPHLVDVFLEMRATTLARACTDETALGRVSRLVIPATATLPS